MFCFTDSHLCKLVKDTVVSKKAAFARGTYRNLKVQFTSYLLFCEFFGLIALPTSVDILSLYIEFLSRSFKSVASIQNYVSGVKTLHLLLGLNFPSEDSDWFCIKLLYRGIARLHPHRPRRALPITPEILLNMFNFLDISEPNDATYWCCFLFSFFLMSRKSNMVPDSVSGFDSSKQLCRKNIILGGDYLKVQIFWSKTIQFGERFLEIPLVRIHNSPLCPVQAFFNMSKLVPASESDPAFLLK